MECTLTEVIKKIYEVSVNKGIVFIDLPLEFMW